MPKGKILSHQELSTEIEASHDRSKQFDICREERNPKQKFLDENELKKSKNKQKIFFDVAITHIKEFYTYLSAKDFMIAVVDPNGYILHMEGSEEIREKLKKRNCYPGYRWLERDVGTTAISLSLERQIPVQLHDKDHYCIRAHGFTSSAAPVFGKASKLIGVLVVSGRSSLTHPHTLIMITAAARSIERQLMVLRRNREMAMHIGFLDNIVEAADTGLLTIDKKLLIQKTNKKGKQILQTSNLSGKPISILENLNLDLEDLRQNPMNWLNKELRVNVDGHNVHLLYSAQPVISDTDDLLGAVLTLEEFGNIKKLANNIVGAKAYFTFMSLIGMSTPFLDAVNMAKRAAASSATVLLQGETGTGKELFAQAIHNASDRRGQAFIPINCGAIPGELLESELFGYVQGAFTGAVKGGKPGKFELANSGTILLDEIGDMPHDMQVKLLRVLQTGEVTRIGAQKSSNTDVRIIACTHVKLSEAVEQKRFREDLFYRLNVFSIRIPPLRERGDVDIIKLAEFFISRFSNDNLSLTTAAMEHLCCYSWPGNVRELENTIERAVHICDGNVIDKKHFSFNQEKNRPLETKLGTLQEMERGLIAATLEHTGGNMAATAGKLGISRATLYRKVKIYSLI